MKGTKILKVNIVLFATNVVLNTSTSILFFSRDRTGIGIGFGIAAVCFLMALISCILSYRNQNHEK